MAYKRESIWDHDLWSDIYEIQDHNLQLLFVRMYRLILDMHNKDVLSEQIADALKGERKIYLSIGQKLAAFGMSSLIASDIVLRIISG